MNVTCELCPKLCTIPDGHRGDCRVRLNINGVLTAVTYNRPVTIHMDPIEKKPLFHVRPGERILSLATAGCNLHCLGCQNWEISQINPEDIPAYDMSASKLADLCERQHCSMVALTYTEPVVYYEYALAIAEANRNRNLDMVLVTAAYINERPWRRLCKQVQAANIDVKFMSDSLYKKYTTGSLLPVLRALEIAVEEGVWVEITNLVIPDVNDQPEDFKKLCTWIRNNLGQSVPIHFSRFSPRYKMSHSLTTSRASLITAWQIAQEVGLHYTYIGNVATDGGGNTYCPHDKTLLIKRNGYSIQQYNITKQGTCPTCNMAIPGIWN